nr:hypothetical protein [uncultured Methanospirillum sp.]
MVSNDPNNILLITLIGAFLGALFGVSLPIYYIEILETIKLRKALKAELNYNLERLKILDQNLNNSSICSPYLRNLMKKNPDFILNNCTHPFPLIICSDLVFKEK